MSNITAENLDFNLLFANTVNREDIDEDIYSKGWYSIVGGINGIPTVRQFNALQYISDLKSKHLYYNKLDKDGGEADALIVAFEKATMRANIESGESISTIMGKINKYFADMQAVAFSGKYSDLSGIPSSLKNPNGLVVKLEGTTLYTYDGSMERNIDFKAGTNIKLGLDANGRLTINTDLSALNAVAFSGKYSDLSDTPTTLKNPKLLSVKLEGTEKYSYDGSVAKNLNFKAGTNVSLGLDTSGNLIINSDYTYTHPTGSGNNHVPAGGSSGQWLKWSSSGTAAWATMLANSLTQAVSGQYALDSYQGKILKDLLDVHTVDIAELNTNLANIGIVYAERFLELSITTPSKWIKLTDTVTIYESGIYIISINSMWIVPNTTTRFTIRAFVNNSGHPNLSCEAPVQQSFISTSITAPITISAGSTIEVRGYATPAIPPVTDDNYLSLTIVRIK